MFVDDKINPSSKNKSAEELSKDKLKRKKNRTVVPFIIGGAAIVVVCLVVVIGSMSIHHANQTNGTQSNIQGETFATSPSDAIEKYVAALNAGNAVLASNYVIDDRYPTKQADIQALKQGIHADKFTNLQIKGTIYHGPTDASVMITVYDNGQYTPETIDTIKENFAWYVHQAKPNPNQVVQSNTPVNAVGGYLTALQNTNIVLAARYVIDEQHSNQGDKFNFLKKEEALFDGVNQILVTGVAPNGNNKAIVSIKLVKNGTPQILKLNTIQSQNNWYVYFPKQ